MKFLYCLSKVVDEKYFCFFQRLTNEWKNGSVRNKTRLSTQDNHHQSPCNLLKVFWLRLIVDEGHSMGNGTTSNLILFASWITSQRRWAMTGTPTPQTSSNNGLGNILGLMKFLKHDYLCTNQGGQQVIYIILSLQISVYS